MPIAFVMIHRGTVDGDVDHEKSATHPGVEHVSERLDSVIMPPRSAFVTSVGRGFRILYAIPTKALLVGLARLHSVPRLPHCRLLLTTALFVETATTIAFRG